MNFRSLELRTIGATVLSAVVGVATAAAGMGAWALVLQSLAFSAASVVLLWAASDWRPSFRYSVASLQALGGFGLKLLGTKLLTFANKSTDTILIGRFLGAASVGAYAIAFNLMLFPISRIVSPIASVVFPAFSRIQEDIGRLAAAWLRATRILAAVVVPVMVGMIVVAPDLVPVLFGERWEAAIPVVQILAWVGLLQALQQMGWIALLGYGEAGLVLRCTVATYAANVLGFIGGLHWGIVGVATGYAIATTLLTPVFSSIVARRLNTRLPAFLRCLAVPSAAGLAMALSVVGARVILLETSIPDAVRLAILVVLGAVVYVAIYAWRAPEILVEARRLISSRMMAAAA
jgi:O-antigen/teichoic acid export membrane protein